ncbi:MAG: hypothetical protein B7Y45_06010 [Sphingomonas sp. 28-66-16]|nr:MAG: hypothetical protein B7Y45_06010 [Sphingomonas sp. 28-66-16]
MAPATPAFAESDPASLAAYVRARAADADGKVDRAATGYAEALAKTPDDPVIAVRAYRAALAAGDAPLANRARVVLERAGVAPADSAVLALAEAAVAKPAPSAEVDKALARLGAGPLSFLVPPLRAWSVGQTDPKRALGLLELTGKNPIGLHYATETRALLMIGDGRIDDGVALLRVLLGVDRGGLELRMAAARLLVGQGRGDLAASLLAGDEPLIRRQRATLGKGAKPDFGFGVSYILTRLAADLGDDETAPLSIVLTRSALRVDPGNDRARLLLAAALTSEEALPSALAVLDEIKPASPYAPAARVERVELLEKAGRDDDALKESAAIARSSDAGVADLQRYGDRLVAAARFDEAAAVYRQAIDQAGPAVDWVLYLQLGGALDQAGKWDEALPLLEKAVALAPDQPIALNYLGYGQLDHGGDVATARRLLEKASSLKPDNLSILDSLAWAYFKAGDDAKALPLLERAAAGEPANETISEHLGDAYWRTGRRYEARYAWRAAAITAEGADAARLATKIADGLARN